MGVKRTVTLSRKELISNFRHREFPTEKICWSPYNHNQKYLVNFASDAEPKWSGIIISHFYFFNAQRNNDFLKQFEWLLKEYQQD